MRPCWPRSLCWVSVASLLFAVVATEPRQLVADDEAAVLRSVLVTLGVNTSELEDASEACNWMGVVCGPDGYDLNLFVPRDSAAPKIPRAIGRLKQLRGLALNGVHGAIPRHLGYASGLRYLWLTNNELTGTIPIQLGQLTELETLGLSRDRNDPAEGSRALINKQACVGLFSAVPTPSFARICYRMLSISE